MITAHRLEVRAGARLLMSDVSFRVAAGDKIGLVGRNGAGKTTLTRILAGEALPASGTVTGGDSVGYLPQDPRTGDPDVLALHRILSARGLDEVVRRLRDAETEMASDDPVVRDRGMRRYEKADAALHAGGGYGVEAEAKQIASSLNIADRVLAQPLRTLSGGQRRRVELARILFSGADTLLLDEPTNHLDADSIVWLRDFLKAFKGGLIVISHDVGLLETTVNKVLHLDANRAEVDVYNMGWSTYLAQRETDERRRRRERQNAERKAGMLMDQANRMRAKATKAQAAQSMMKRAERLLDGVETERRTERIGHLITKRDKIENADLGSHRRHFLAEQWNDAKRLNSLAYPHQKMHLLPGELQTRVVKVRSGLAAKRLMAHVADDADNGHPIRAAFVLRPAQGDALAEWISRRPDFLREPLAHDANARRFHRVAVLKGAASQ